MDTTHLATLAAFRAATSTAFGRRRDALFELCGTLLTTGPVPALPVCACSRSISAAGAASRTRWRPARSMPVPWSTCSADTRWPAANPSTPSTSASGRGVTPRPARSARYSHASRHAAGQPIVAGWASSWIAQVNVARESWTAPLRGRRRRPQEQASVVAAEQIKAFLPHLPIEAPRPWFLFDAGADPVPLTPALGDTAAAILVRWRSGRCFSADPTTQPATGRPRRHGHQLACDTPATWLPPDGSFAVEDRQDGRVRVRAWTGLHPKTHGQHPSALPTADDRVGAGRCCSSRFRVCRGRRASRQRSGAGGTRPTLRTPSRTGDPHRACRRAPLRCGASVPLPGSHRSIGRSRGAPPRPSRPLDLARGPGLYAGAPRPHSRGRPAPCLAASPASGHTHPGTGSPGMFDALGPPPHPGLRATTLRTLARTAQRQALGTRDPLSGHHQSPPQRVRRRLNLATLSFSSGR
jgi:hypothetical protein